RFSRDWSSDVCSSDLGAVEWVHVPAILAGGFMRRAFFRHDLVLGPAGAQPRHEQLFGGAVGDGDYIGLALVFHRHPVAEVLHERSEERRVGKESRARW